METGPSATALSKSRSVCSYILVRRDRNFMLRAFSRLTDSSGLSSVRILFLSAQSTFLLHVFEGIIHQSSITSLIAFCLGAVHQFLFRKGWNLISSHIVCDGISTLKRSSGQKGPARSA